MWEYQRLNVYKLHQIIDRSSKTGEVTGIDIYCCRHYRPATNISPLGPKTKSLGSRKTSHNGILDEITGSTVDLLNHFQASRVLLHRDYHLGQSAFVETEPFATLGKTLLSTHRCCRQLNDPIRRREVQVAISIESKIIWKVKAHRAPYQRTHRGTCRWCRHVSESCRPDNP